MDEALRQEVSAYTIPNPGFAQDIGESFSTLLTATRIQPGAVTVNGRLPPKVIQRIVRQKFGRLRLCYESGLKKNPALQGMVTIKFVIDRSGSVSSARAGRSDMGDPTTVSCVVNTFKLLSFPELEGGIVTVVYPFVFKPGT